MTDENQNMQMQKRESGEIEAYSPQEVLKQIELVQQIMGAAMKDKEHYGVIPGCGDKKVLLKPGAEKLSFTFRLVPSYDITRIDLARGHREYQVTCSLHSAKSGGFMGQGVGAASTMESKYRFRVENTGKPVPKEYWEKGRDPAMLGGPDHIPKKVNGQWMILRRVEHDNPADSFNTVLKMAKKRCLGSTTPVVVKLSDGPIRTNLSKAYDLFCVSGGKMEIASPEGWVKVTRMWRDIGKTCKVLTLRDGSVIYATDEHRFPTKSGIKYASELRAGDSLLRERIAYSGKMNASYDIGWVVGFYLAEGHKSAKSVKFTMHAKEWPFAEKVIKIAEYLGCTSTHTIKGNTMRLVIGGHAFQALMAQFIHGNTCYNKHLSMWAWRQGKEFHKGILDGFLDGDGHFHKRKRGRQELWLFGFTGVNTELSHDLRTLCAILGFRCRIVKGKSVCNGKTFKTYRGWISFSEPAYNGADLNQIVSIGSKNGMVVYDLEVASESHLFCLANGIVSHNSHVDAVLTATAASDLFTQDVEDIKENLDRWDSEGAIDVESQPAKPDWNRQEAKPAQQPARPAPQPAPAATQKAPEKPAEEPERIDPTGGDGLPASQFGSPDEALAAAWEVQVHFGKNQGKALSQLPGNALNWYINKWMPRDYPEGSGKFKDNDLWLRRALNEIDRQRRTEADRVASQEADAQEKQEDNVPF